MDPARILHRIGVLLFAAALVLVPVVIMTAATGPLLGRSAGDHLLWLVEALGGGVVLYGAGTAWELVRDGRQAAGFR